MSGVAIIGGGFTGALVAWHLARLAPGARIVVIEPRARLGAGLAYSTTDPAHRINVPASRMTMRTDIRDGLHRWILQRDPPLSPGTRTPSGALFPQRGVVADYVAEALAPDLAQGRIRHLRGRATGLSGGERFRIGLEDGRRISADHVVIATSHPPPALPASLAGLRDDPRLIADPSDAAAIARAARGAPDAAARDGTGDWDGAKAGDRDGNGRRGGRMLVLGTGLTSADVIASLDRQGYAGTILALSRRGQRSRGHAPEHGESPEDFTRHPATTARGLLARVRAAVARDAARGLPWQATLDNVRRDGAAIWAALPACQRARLVARLRVWWDVHRFRIAPQVEAVLDRLIDQGRLRVRAGRLRGIEAAPGGLSVTWCPRGGTPVSETFNGVILTTGPGHEGIVRGSALLADAAARGLLRADALGLGLEVTQGCRAVGAGGAVTPNLWVAGPLARGHVGELMGIPEVTAHAERVAQALAERIAAPRGS